MQEKITENLDFVQQNNFCTSKENVNDAPDLKINI